MAGLRPEVFSVLNELVRGAKQKMSLDEWDKFLAPGRVLRREGVQFPLKPDELKYGPYAKIRSGLDRPEGPSKVAPADMYRMLQQELDENPPYTTQVRLPSNNKVSVRQQLTDEIEHHPTFGYTLSEGPNDLFGVADGAVFAPSHFHMGPKWEERLPANLSKEHLAQLRSWRERYLNAVNSPTMSYQDSYQLEGPKLGQQENLTLIPESDYQPSDVHYGGQRGLLSWNRTTDRPVALPENWEADPYPVQTGHATNIEETQSDWHQKARESGYLDPTDQEGNDKIYELGNRVSDLNQQLLEHRHSQPSLYDYEEHGVRPSSQQMEGYRAWRNRLDELDHQLQNASIEFNQALEKRNSTPPLAPFANNWHELEMRKALADAVAKDHDWLTWTTGDQQLERWNNHMQRRVGRIQWSKEGDKYKLHVWRSPTGHESYEGGDQTLDLAPSQLHEYLGSDMSAQILNSQDPTGVITGDNLRIGGQGMRRHYDNNMGSYGKKLLQQYGGEGEPQLVSIPSGDNDNVNRFRLRFDNLSPGDFDLPNPEEWNRSNEFTPWLKKRLSTYFNDYQMSPEAQRLLDEVNKHHANWHYARDTSWDLQRKLESHDEEDPVVWNTARDLFLSASDNVDKHYDAFNQTMHKLVEQIAKENEGPSVQKVWGIRLTPKMKENVRRAGLPLFSTLPFVYGASQGEDAQPQEDPDLPPVQGYARGGLTRFASGGSSGKNELTIPPTNITVTPYPMDASLYGLGPAHQFISYDYGSTAPPPAPPPAPGTSGGGTGETGGTAGVPTPGPNDYWHGAGSGSGIYQGGNAGGANNADHVRSVTDISRMLSGEDPNGYVSSDNFVDIPDWANRLWSAASMALPSPYGTILGAAKTGLKLYNDYETDRARTALGMPGLGIDQAIAGLLGIRNYGGLTNGTISNPEQSPYGYTDDEGNRQGIAITVNGDPYHEGWFGWGDKNPGGTIGLDKANLTRQAELGQGIFGNVLTPEGIVPSLNAIPTKPAAPVNNGALSFTPGQVTRAPVSEGTPTSPQMQPIYRGDGTLVGYQNLVDGSYTSPAAQNAANSGGSGSYMSSHAGESGNSAGSYGGSYGANDHTAVGASGQLGHIKRGGLTQNAPKRMARGGALNIGKYLGDVAPPRVLPRMPTRLGFNPNLIQPQKPAVDMKSLQEILSRNTEMPALSGDDGASPQSPVAPFASHPTSNVTAAPDTATVIPQEQPPGDISDILRGYYNRLNMVESGGNPGAVNPRSGATGTYQFTKPTWEDLVKRYPQAGLSIEGIKDAKQQETAVNLLTTEHLNRLKQMGQPINDVTLYSMHLLGQSGGEKFLRSLYMDPDAPITRYISSQAYAMNKELFQGKNGQPLTVKQVKDVLKSRFSRFELTPDPSRVIS